MARSLEKGLGDFNLLKVYMNHIHGSFLISVLGSYFRLGSQFKVTLIVLGEDILISVLGGHEGSLKHCSWNLSEEMGL